MKAFKSAIVAATLGVVLSGGPSPVAAQNVILELDVNIDYYLLNFFNQLHPLPRDVNGEAVNEYSILNLFSPSFFFVNHDLDFASPRRTVHSNALGGSGVAWVSGPGSLSLNPAGMASGRGGGVYVGAGSRSGSGESRFAEDYLPDSGIIGILEPIGQTFDTRMWLNHSGLYLTGHPLYSPESTSGLARAAGRVALGIGYRRFLDTYNGADFLTTWLPEGGIGGLSAEIVTGAQSREKGGVDALVLGAATSLGDEDSAVRLNVGANVNLISGRVQADQVYTISLLTQLVAEFPGPIADNAFVRQKFEGTAIDVGVQAGLFSDQLRLGAVYRPAYTLEMTSGKFVSVEPDFAIGAIVYRGTISPYDMELPSTINAGGTLRLSGLLGTGDDRSGVLGYLHRFFGRSEVSAEFASQKLSEATIVQKNETLSNPGLAEQYTVLNTALNDFFPDQGFDFNTTMPLFEGSALLNDKDSIHFGFETPIWLRDTWRVDARLGYETVPIAFPSLVLGDAEPSETGFLEQQPLYNDDGTPQLEDITGDAISLGFGFHTGKVDFDFAYRKLTYDYVAFWNGTTGAQPGSWYNPLLEDEIYEPFFGEEEATTAAKIAPSISSFQFGATLRF